MKIPCKNRIFLAPMAEINDLAFRLVCKKAGCGLTYTGMINPLSKEKLQLQDKPALQLFSHSEKGIKEFIKKYEKKVVLFDFNLGCPAYVAKKSGFGVFMHSNLKLIEKILKIMRSSTKKPITVKLRKSPNALKIAKIAEKYCAAIAIHPRTQTKGYSSDPDIKFAEKLKKSVKIPVIYSGNATKNLLKKFDYIMIGREAIGNPSVFGKKTTFKDYLVLAKKYKIPFKKIKNQAIFFTKGKKGAKKIRTELMKTKDLTQIQKVLQKAISF
ncbi:MAG: tRNA-dihydrouridine synthase family protein [archaeon]